MQPHRQSQRRSVLQSSKVLIKRLENVFTLPIHVIQFVACFEKPNRGEAVFHKWSSEYILEDDKACIMPYDDSGAFASAAPFGY